MNSPWRIWTGFAAVIAVLWGATAWISTEAIRLDRAESTAQARAAIEENVRLALWRMDSALAPLLAQEMAHPQYLDLDSMATVSPGFQIGPPSDMAERDRAAHPPSLVLARFHFTTPVSPPVSGTATGSLSSEFADLASRVPRQQLAQALPLGGGSLGAPIDAPPVIALAGILSPESAAGQSRSAIEFQQRNHALMRNNFLVQGLQEDPRAPRSRDQLRVATVPMTPLWTAGEMIVARRVDQGPTTVIQGGVLDWPGLQTWLLAMISDLLPRARLEPLENIDAAGDVGMLAALPVRLVAASGADANLATPGIRPPLAQMLGMAWAAVLLASALGALMVASVLRLSQRRAAFVSAVTHELRTPLTTFRMYTEMLAQGMVREESAKREYLETLRDQSLRLSHLVENVLVFARLERGRGEAATVAVPLRTLLGSVLPGLKQRIAMEGMELVTESESVEEEVVRVHTSAVEQILINLVDNACKYARSAEDRRIHLRAWREDMALAVCVRDHGPGIPRGRRWFRPFGKSVQEAAATAPGVGLGLAISRRLARQMGGTLMIDHAVSDGAALVLRLRIDG